LVGYLYFPATFCRHALRYASLRKTTEMMLMIMIRYDIRYDRRV